MRIRELSLHNYRGFGEKRVEFSDQFTVIAGVNGRGKTAILDALALLMSRLLSQIAPAGGGWRSFSPTDIHGDRETLTLALKANCAGIPVDFNIGYGRSNRRARARKLGRPLCDAIKEAYGNVETAAAKTGPLAVYYTTDRAGFRRPRKLPRDPGSGRKMAYHRALINQLVDYRDFMARFRVMLNSEEERDSPNPSFLGEGAVAAIQRCVEVLLGGFANLRVEEQPPRLLVDKDGHILDISQLSDGERSLIAIVTDLCRRLALANPGLNDPLQGTGVVLIDEIELHLHPKWQREVVDKLRLLFPNIQFIATTHSPYVIQALRPGELHLLDNEMTGEYANRGLEEITVKVMGIENPELTPHYHEMLVVARDYYRLLEVARPADEQQRRRIRRILDELVHPYADNPAYQAYLEMHRVAHFGEGNRDETS
jgi:predicted ATP-binding protein involved in virulence